jgi:hypothetical protein
VRLKLAAALALLHQRTDVDEQTWELSGQLLAISDRTRAGVLRTLREKEGDRPRSQGRADAVRDEARREHVAERAASWAAALWRGVEAGAAGKGSGHDKHAPDEGCTLRCLSTALRHHPGADREAALAHAVGLEWITVVGDRYRPGASRPT